MSARAPSGSEVPNFGTQWYDRKNARRIGSPPGPSEEHWDSSSKYGNTEYRGVQHAQGQLFTNVLHPTQFGGGQP